MNQSASIYQDMATRTGSSIYIGVVGPVRTDYASVISYIEYFAGTLGKLLKESDEE